MELWQYRAYIFYSIKARLIAENINNHLGIFWLFFDPVMRMIIYYFVFVYLIKHRTEDFCSFLLVGIVAYNWFSKNITVGGNSIIAAGGLIKQLHMPKMIFPTIASLVRTVEFLIVFTLLSLYLVARGQLHLTWLAIPAVIAAQFLLTYGVTLIAAGIIPFVPDLSFLISSGLTALFFLSGVFYEITPANPNYRWFMLNPVARLLEQYRCVLLHGHWPDWSALAQIGGLGAGIIILMTLFIRKMDCYYPRVAK